MDQVHIHTSIRIAYVCVCVARACANDVYWSLLQPRDANNWLRGENTARAHARGLRALGTCAHK